ncbi:putative bifunctional UDP-N-acetylglucosamine transferase and deubiquitinase ALG13 [Huso huso]|uniref:ubiquitinyl hydrolase 1 n=1 Tax=Huso huso TaxID=61971 RepID=A0ABR0Y1A5_HUSHU
MRANRCTFEPFVEGSFEKYLERLEDPKETAGQVEIKALSLMYKRRFIIYRHPGKPPTEVADEDYKEKVVLCCSNYGYYDNVYPKHYPAAAAVCQAILYEVLYKDVFGIGEEEIHSALDVFHGSGGSRAATAPRCAARTPKPATTTRAPQQTRTCRRPSKDLFSYKVLKALDPSIYRNVEFEVWRQLEVTCKLVVFQVRLEPGGKYYNAFIQEVGHHSSAVTVFIEELGEKPVGRRWPWRNSRGSLGFPKTAAQHPFAGPPPSTTPGSTNMAPYKQYRPHPSSQRAGRGYGPPT